MRKITISALIAVLLAPSMMAAPTLNSEAKNQPVSIEPNRILGQAETLNGTLMTLFIEQRLIVVKTTDGVPYNFKVVAATEIEIGGKKASFEDLAALINANLSVTFVPMQRGNVARKIEVRR